MWRPSLAAAALALTGLLVAAPGSASARPSAAGPPAPGTIFVADIANNSIIEYAPGATGNATPIATIAGSSTGLSNPVAMALSPSGDLFVADHGIQAVTEYAPGANGNVAPIATITGVSTGLGFPGGVALNSSGDLFVANGFEAASQSSVTEYAPGANGNVAPIATIPSSSFGNSDPGDVELDSSGDLYVSAPSDQAVFEFAPGATGSATPIATITGAGTGLSGPTGLALNPAGSITVANSSDGTVTTYAAKANGNATPTATLSVPGPEGIALDPSGDLFDAFTGEQQGINEYAPGATGDAAPIGTIAGSNTGISDPAGVLIAPAAPPAQLAFVSDPSSGASGAALGTQPAVAIENAAGGVVKTDTSKVKLSLTTVSGNPVATLACTTNPVPASAGVATFAGCKVNEPASPKIGGTYLLRATDGSLTAAKSVVFTISTQSAPAVNLVWNKDPVAESGSLTPGQPVTVAVTAHSGTSAKGISGALVYVSLTRADVTPGHPDNASATCGSTKLPGYCKASAQGVVAVTYKPATTPGAGSDTLTAALDPDGTSQAASQYTYAAPSSAKVVGLSWDPSPIAPVSTLNADHKVTVTLAALAADGGSVPSARVEITLTPAPGSDASITGKGCTGGRTELQCKTDSTGHVTLTYTRAGPPPHGGSDALQATTSPAGFDAPTALDLYTYDKISLSWSTNPIAEAGSLSAGQKVPLTVTARLGTKVDPGAGLPVAGPGRCHGETS